MTDDSIFLSKLKGKKGNKKLCHIDENRKRKRKKADIKTHLG